MQIELFFIVGNHFVGAVNYGSDVGEDAVILERLDDDFRPNPIDIAKGNANFDQGFVALFLDLFFFGLFFH